MTDGLLPELVRRESRTFLQYTRESYPWARGPGETQLRESIFRMADAEAEQVTRLGRMLQKRHIPLPGLGAYPSVFTNFNFLDTQSLVPKLLAAQRRSLTELERDLAAVTDDEFRATLESYRDLKRRHLDELDSLSARAKQPA